MHCEGNVMQQFVFDGIAITASYPRDAICKVISIQHEKRLDEQLKQMQKREDEALYLARSLGDPDAIAESSTFFQEQKELVESNMKFLLQKSIESVENIKFYIESHHGINYIILQ